MCLCISECVHFHHADASSRPPCPSPGSAVITQTRSEQNKTSATASALCAGVSCGKGRPSATQLKEVRVKSHSTKPSCLQSKAQGPHRVCLL